MARVCQITGKKRMIGNNVSHSKRRTKREFAVNLREKRFWLESEKRFVYLSVTSWMSEEKASMSFVSF